jgi:hypothetical protein
MTFPFLLLRWFGGEKVPDFVPVHLLTKILPVMFG